MSRSVRLGLLWLTACLAACSDRPTPPAAGNAQACAVEQVAELPLTLVAGGILVGALINRTAVQMQIDTGSTASMIDKTIATRLSLPSDEHRRTTLHGIGGQIDTPNTLLQSLEVGGQQWQSLSLSTGRLAINFQEPVPVAGLLGADLLSGFDIELDVPHGRMVLWHSQRCSGDFITWPTPHYLVPLIRQTSNRMVARIEIDGHPVSAMIDWGAQSSTMTRTLATQLGVTEAMLATDPTGTSRGVDRTAIAIHRHRFATIRIGPEVLHNVAVNIGDYRLPYVGMLLGADFARSRRIWLSYATGQMFVAVTRTEQ